MSNNPTNVRGGDVNLDQLDRWFADRKKYHAERAREAAAKRRVIPFANAAERLVRQEKLLDDTAKNDVIRMVGLYARRNKLEFDGTFAGACRLAAHANRVLRDHAAAMDAMDSAAA